jgi:hypothetical protein
MSLYPGSLIPDPIFAKGSRLGWAEHRAYPRSLQSIQRNSTNLSVIARERAVRPQQSPAWAYKSSRLGWVERSQRNPINLSVIARERTLRPKQSPPWANKRPVSAFFAIDAAKLNQSFSSPKFLNLGEVGGGIFSFANS